MMKQGRKKKRMQLKSPCVSKPKLIDIGEFKQNAQLGTPAHAHYNHNTIVPPSICLESQSIGLDTHHPHCT